MSETHKWQGAKVSFINREKVYVYDTADPVKCICGTPMESGQILIVSHRDLVNNLNVLFEQAESGSGEYSMLDTMITLLAQGRRIKWSTVNKKDVYFDNLAKARRQKTLTMHHEKTRPLLCGKPQVIRGGLYEYPAKNVDRLSDKFRVFLEKERAGTGSVSS